VNERHFRLHVVAPTLAALNMWSKAAEELLLGTAVHESGGLEALDQVTGDGDETLGPAYGVYQIEEATHVDVWRYLDRRPDLRSRVKPFVAMKPFLLDQLVTNLCYATAIARLIYWRAREPLPKADDLDGLAAYWKRHYNTELGAGTPAKWLQDYRWHVLGQR